MVDVAGNLGPHLVEIGEEILSLRKDHPIRVAVDGFCSSGKSTISTLLTEIISSNGRSCIQISTDDFQNPPEIRWKRGENSAEGFYRDAVDSEALIREVLIPLGPGGTLEYRTTTYDVFALKPKLSEKFRAASDAVIIVDGLFLHGTEYEGAFDFTIFVACPFDTCIKRAIARNQEKKDSLTELEALYARKYVPGFELYLSENQPMSKASVVIHNNGSDDTR